MANEAPKPYIPSWRRPPATSETDEVAHNDHNIRLRRGERRLINSASGLMQEALTAWTDDNYERLSLLAPVAVEHLGKAVLWMVSPTLLVPLKTNAEKALVALATRPDLEDSKTRTVGLDGVLARADLLLGGLPLTQDETQRLINVRNGAVHVGTNAASRDVLVNCLTLCARFLDELGEKPNRFYGTHTSSAAVLTDERKTEVGHRVAARMAKARSRLTSLEEQVGDLFFDDYTSAQIQAAAELDPADYGIGLHGLEHACPECGCEGRLFGRVEADGNYEDEYDSEGDIIDRQLASWTTWMYPSVFICCVCKLEFYQADELAEASVPSGYFTIDWPDDLSPQFDPEKWIAAEYMAPD